MKRPRDQILLLTEGGGAFDKFESIDLTTDVTAFTELSIKVGNAGAWPQIESILYPGRGVKVLLNGRLQFVGRVESDDIPTESSTGTIPTIKCRTKLSDAKYASADAALKFTDVSVKDFILKLFEPLGYGPADFLFAPMTAVNLVTGKTRYGKPPADLEAAKADQLKVQPPETIWECALRVLKRHHMIIWDVGNGQIVVGKPDDTQAPLYKFLCRKGPASRGNNVLSVKRIIDWTDVANEVWVYGGGVKKDVMRAPNKGVAVDLDVAQEYARSGNFNRRVILPDDAAKTLDQASAKAKRELAARIKAKDAWEVKADGWSLWDGAGLIPYCINTTAELDVDDGGPGGRGRYLSLKVSRSLDKDSGPTSTIGLVAPGTFADL